MIWWWLSAAALEFAVLFMRDRSFGEFAVSLVVSLILVGLGYLHKIYKHLIGTTPTNKEKP